MRIDRVYIDGFKNLKKVEADFDHGALTTVVIGQNGSGKSNLIEAVVEVFRHVDLATAPLRFVFQIDYVLRGHKVGITNRDGVTRFVVDGATINAARFRDHKGDYFPDLIFGYYSGTGRRLERLFDGHQARYYSVINKVQTPEVYEDARAARRMFYCRPVHGVLALLSEFAFPRDDPKRGALLRENLKIVGFHSALAHFKQPSWFKTSNRRRAGDDGPTPRGRRSHEELHEQALDLWGAKGPAGDCARALLDAAFHPVTPTGKVVDDYRDRPKTEAQLACFLPDRRALASFAGGYDNDQQMFAALEAVDISDLFREVHVWVARTDDNSGDLSFSDLSDGERQLMMVLGLIRASRGREALFLLDEPDTHLNPAWQLTYLDLIREWTDVAADTDMCQIIMTSHNPLTIAALRRDEVRIIDLAADGSTSISRPYVDPRGMGFTATVTEIFGLPTTLDPETQRQIDERNALSRLEKRSEDQERLLIELNDKLGRLGFMNDSREPLYQDFLSAWQDVRYADRPPMNPEQLEARRVAMQTLIKSLSGKVGAAS